MFRQKKRQTKIRNSNMNSSTPSKAQSIKLRIKKSILLFEYIFLISMHIKTRKFSSMRNFKYWTLPGKRTKQTEKIEIRIKISTAADNTHINFWPFFNWLWISKSRPSSRVKLIEPGNRWRFYPNFLRNWRLPQKP